MSVIICCKKYMHKANCNFQCSGDTAQQAEDVNEKWQAQSLPSVATVAVYQRRHMPINSTTSVSSHRQQFNKEPELLAAQSLPTDTSVTRELFSCLQELDKRAILLRATAQHWASWHSAPRFSSPTHSGRTREDFPQKWASRHSMVSLRIQIESVPGHTIESYFYKSENP